MSQVVEFGATSPFVVQSFRGNVSFQFPGMCSCPHCLLLSSGGVGFGVYFVCHVSFGGGFLRL